MTIEEINQKREELLAKRKYEQEHRIKIITEHFNNLTPFETIDDIPDIPKVDEETYNNIIIPNLIRCGAISKDKLEIGKYYVGTCRNASKAIWDGDKFTYKRTKWGTTYDEDINHFQDDDGYDLFVPIKLLEDEVVKPYSAFGLAVNDVADEILKEEINNKPI